MLGLGLQAKLGSLGLEEQGLGLPYQLPRHWLTIPGTDLS